MHIDKVKAYFAAQGMADRVREFDTSSATVELAAIAVGVEPARIAKTLSFRTAEGCLLVVTAGDTKVDNQKFKQQFGLKAKMLRPEEVEGLLHQQVGGVCPFVLPEEVPVYLDASMQRFDAVYPACGSASSAVALTCEELFQHAGAVDWVEICKLPD